MKQELVEDLNKILIKLKEEPLINQCNVHYGDYTTDRIPDPKHPDDRDWDDIKVNMDKVRLINLKTAIVDFLENRDTLYNMFDDYKLSSGD